MLSPTIYSAIGAGVGIFGAAVTAASWAYRRVRASVKREMQIDISRQFLAELATNHLPHIYHVLELIAANLGVEITEPPPIKYFKIEGTNGTDSSRH